MSSSGQKKPMFRFSWILIVLGVSFVAHAESGLPHVFENGTPARAEEVNANFRYLEERVESQAGMASGRVIYVDAIAFSSRHEDNGAALLEALDRLTGAGPNNRYQIVLRPGVYDLGGETLHIPNYVSVVGAGPYQTTLRSSAETAVTMEALARLESLSIHQWVEGVGRTVVVSPDGIGGVTYLQDVEIQATSPGNLTVLASTQTISLFLRNVSILAMGRGDVVGLDSSGTGFVNAVDLTIRAKNEAVAGSTHAVLLSSRGASRFASSHFQVEGGDLNIPLRTGSDFNGTAHLIGSRFVTDDAKFARIEGTGGKVYVGASEVAGGYYQAKGTTTIRCAQVFNRDFADLSECNPEPI